MDLMRTTFVICHFRFCLYRSRMAAKRLYFYSFITWWTNVLSDKRPTLWPVNSSAHQQWSEPTFTLHAASIHIRNLMNSLLELDWFRGFCLRYLWVPIPTHNEYKRNGSFSGSMTGKTRQYRSKINEGKMVSWNAHLCSILIVQEWKALLQTYFQVVFFVNYISHWPWRANLLSGR
jgi:hypothetical protein